MIATLIILSGLAHASDPAEAKPAEPTASQEALYAALKPRDGSPDCASLSDHSEELATDLLWLVDNATQPPWVGVRAAQCVIKHHHTAQAERIKSWMTSPEKRGLAILAMGLLDELPKELSVELSAAALAGPLAEDAKKYIAVP